MDEVFRAWAWLRKHHVPIVFEGRRRAEDAVANPVKGQQLPTRTA
jgi:hypothetical protein